MSFAPQIPMAGPAGWRFLVRTEATQKAAFEKGVELQREIDYFASNIGKVKSAEDLVADRRLLKVALGAFGLEDEVDKKALIRKVLESAATDPKALANRLTNPAFKRLAQTFGFGDAEGGLVGGAGFAARITNAYKTRAFEVAVGNASEDMRLAMNFRREAAELSAGEKGGSWYTVIGSAPLRKIFEKAYGLPSSFGQIDVDRQRDMLRDKTAAVFGKADLSVFSDPANVQKLIDRFLARAQLEAGPGTSSVSSPALTLLQNSSGRSAGLYNLLLSGTR